MTGHSQVYQMFSKSTTTHSQEFTRNCYKLNELHMIVTPTMIDQIITTVGEIKYNSIVQRQKKGV